MPALVTNNASATLSAGITASATIITLGSGQGSLFPVASGTSVFWATIVNSSNQVEIVKVTARATDSLTVIRGQDGTTAFAFNVGDKLELRPTAALFNAKLDVDTAALTYETIPNVALKAPLASPTLTGIPAAPTPATDTDTTQIATTAFVQAAARASTATAAKRMQGDTWQVVESAGILYFQQSGVNKAKLDSYGNFTVVGDVIAFGTV